MSILTLTVKSQSILWYLTHLHKLAKLLHLLLLGGGLLFVPWRQYQRFRSLTRITKLLLEFEILLTIDKIAEICAKLLKVYVFIYFELLILRQLFVLVLSLHLLTCIKLTLFTHLILCWVLFLPINNIGTCMSRYHLTLWHKLITCNTIRATSLSKPPIKFKEIFRSILMWFTRSMLIFF